MRSVKLSARDRRRYLHWIFEEKKTFGPLYDHLESRASFLRKPGPRVTHWQAGQEA